jgi:hypothetical protein
MNMSQITGHVSTKHTKLCSALAGLSISFVLASLVEGKAVRDRGESLTCFE